MGIAQAIAQRLYQYAKPAAVLLSGIVLPLASNPALGEPQVRLPSLDAACTPPADAPSAANSEPYRPASDWAYLCYYHADNAALMQGEPPDIVFIGDSITRNWITIDPSFFAQGRRADRGISAQTSAQMLLRFTRDAIAMRPKVIHLMAGTNDIAANPGGLAIESYKANITAMADLARANGITLVIGAIPPADRFPWRPAMQPAEDIRMLNRWLADFASARGLAFIDYHTALATPEGAAREGLTRDGVHPVAAGYRIMADLANPVLARAVARAERKAKGRK
jgi:lysophospholipase L1-like esterase